MAKHFVIMSSSYSKGTRIAIDYAKKEELNTEFIEEQVKKIKKACGDTVPISIHTVQTETEEWSSLVKADQFFQDFEVVNIDEFIMFVKIDRKLRGIDVAKYILSKIQCTHLKLQKLVYLCYAEYLTQNKERLFEDKIYAFRYGPVIQTVYNEYKTFGDDTVQDDDVLVREILNIMPARSRILFADSGTKKLECIDEVIKKYGDYKASELVELTHQEKTPWSKTYSNENFQEIEDETILEYHNYEK